MVTDEDIIDYFVDKERCEIFAQKVRKSHLEKIPDMVEYMNHRFPEPFKNYCEVVSRIFHKIEKKPVCKICGKPKPYFRFKIPYKDNPWCGHSCQLRDPEFIKWRDSNMDYTSNLKKAKETCLKKYGNPNYKNFDKAHQTCLAKYGDYSHFGANSSLRKRMEEETLKKYGKRTLTNPEKIRETKLERYGDPAYTNVEKIRKTMLERYGAEYTLCSDELREKVMSTKEQRYGDKNYNNKEKIKKTTLEKYGVECLFQLKSVRDKIDYEKITASMKKNHTLNSSKQEDRLCEILCSLFENGDVMRYYQDDRYVNPSTGYEYVCDFYIKSLDLFIELQGHYTHGTHPFSINDENDVKELNRLLSYGDDKPSYKQWAHVWSELDVVKRESAKSSGIRYLEIFGTKFNKKSVQEDINNIIER